MKKKKKANFCSLRIPTPVLSLLPDTVEERMEPHHAQSFSKEENVLAKSYPLKQKVDGYGVRKSLRDACDKEKGTEETRKIACTEKERRGRRRR